MRLEEEAILLIELEVCLGVHPRCTPKVCLLRAEVYLPDNSGQQNKQQADGSLFQKSGQMVLSKRRNNTDRPEPKRRRGTEIPVPYFVEEQLRTFSFGGQKENGWAANNGIITTETVIREIHQELIGQLNKPNVQICSCRPECEIRRQSGQESE